MKTATHLNLIQGVDEKTGASIGMWAGVDCAPIEWAKHFQPKPTLCRNAFAGLNAWYCYHWNGAVVKGKESVSERNRCEACEIAEPPYAEEPSFMKSDEE